MLKAIVTYLNLKLDLLNYFDLTRCLVELKDSEIDGGTLRQPAEYIPNSNGDYDAIDWDEYNGMSYWRLREEPSSERTETRKYKAGSKNNVETTVPLRLVFAVPREKLTEDDAYSFDRIRQTILKQFTVDDDVLKAQLGAISVRITQSGSNSDAKEVWDEETEGTGTFETKYEVVFGSIDIDVVIISKHDCLPTECDNVESDIIRAFDWCGNTAVTVGRLTQEQQDCISDFLCSCADATVENSDQSYQTTVASGGTLVLPDITVTDSDGSTSSVPSVQDVTCTPCQDATVQLNGVEVATPESGATVDIPVNLDGVPSGSWDGDSWEVTSAPCADATVQLNGVDMTDIPSGDTENIQVRQSSGSTLVGSKQGQYWRIDDSEISINGSPVADVMAEDSLDVDVLQDGSPVGSWNGSEWIIPSCSASVEVSVSLSDDTPKLGQVITITATATGITPTSYTFYLPQQDGSFETVTQAGNTYAWAVSKYDAFTVTVTATDGSSEGSGSATGTTTGDVDSDAFITAHDAATGGTMDATMQGYTLGFFLRLKGINTTHPENVFAEILSESGEIYPMLPDSVSGASIAGYSINAIDPSSNATMVGFVPADATVNGLTGGSGKYMTLNNAANDFDQNDVSTHAYIRTSAVAVPIGGGDGDANDNTSGVSIFAGFSSSRIIAKCNSEDYLTTASSIASNTGFISVQRDKSDRFSIAGNGDDYDIVALSSLTPSSQTIYGMAMNNNGTAARNYTGSVSCLIDSPYLNECQLKTLQEAVQWLQEQIGRNV